ncbi:hypothetical protein [Burkholderia sp. BDU5]|uniref:hypothetical protein n=1 Tax=Burkholderia sp. BDU5 TaxID=1385590 RepID=UPI00075853BE|nr:hypothetical protein [Burkholderia sp. BDU5]KVE38539.1 hypothetical protein WS69_08530 [Burkholderia sp. BDU5]
MFNALANTSALDDHAPRTPCSGGSEPRDMNRPACRSTCDAWSIRTKRQMMLDPRVRGARCIGRHSASDERAEQCIDLHYRRACSTKRARRASDGCAKTIAAHMRYPIRDMRPPPDAHPPLIDRLIQQMRSAERDRASSPHPAPFLGNEANPTLRGIAQTISRARRNAALNRSSHNMQPTNPPRNHCMLNE